MKTKKKLLIIDDRAIFIQGVRYLIDTKIKKTQAIQIEVSRTYKNALKKLAHNISTNQSIDYLFLNIDIKCDNNYGLILVKKYICQLRTFNPNIKIFIFSHRVESYRISYTISHCQPLGFILEKDLNFNEILRVFDNMLYANLYFSKSVNSILKKLKKQYIKIDEIDFHILYFLKNGLKSNFIQKYIPRTNSAIEKRKYKLKDVLGYGKCSDEQLVQVAIKKGIL